MTTILVTGASGMLGRACMQRFASLPDVSLIGLCHTRSAPSLRPADLTDLDSIPALLDELSPDLIVHTAAIRKPDEYAKSKIQSRALNVDATRAIAHWVAAHPSTWMAYISSDYVFNGTCPPYTPESPLAPANEYGQSKADGELVLHEEAPLQSAILRVPLLYGNVTDLSESSATSVVLALQKPGPILLDDWAIRYPTHVDNVADILAQMAEKRLIGTYHWTASTPLTKYAMGCIAAALLPNPPSFGRSATPANGTEPRPHDCHLDRSTLESLGITSPDISFEKTLASIL